MDAQKIFIIFTIYCCQAAGQNIPTAAQVTAGKTVVKTLIDNNVVANEKIFIPGLVRLAFHDCVGQDHCDGCIDHSLPDNGGLQRYTDDLDPLYNTHKASMGDISRADFYILAAYTALEEATVSQTDKFTGTMKFGRADCPTSPTEDETNTVFPKATWDFEQAHTFFQSEFGFVDRQESVAILGAHTLGRTRTDNSGFEGRWVRGSGAGGVRNTEILDNQYYLQLRGNWTQKQVAESGMFQWQRPGTDPNVKSEAGQGSQPNIMLNVDMGILFKMDTDIGNGVTPILNENTGENQCLIVVVSSNCIVGTECCETSLANTGRANNNFRRYTKGSSQNTLFIQDFTAAFRKMTHDKNNAVRLLQDPL